MTCTKRWVLGPAVAMTLGAAAVVPSAGAQRLPAAPVMVAPFSASEPALASLALKARDALVRALVADSAVRVLPAEVAARTRDLRTGRPQGARYYVGGEVGTAGSDTIVAVWRVIDVETGALLTTDSVKALRGADAVLLEAVAGRTRLIPPSR